MPYLVKELRSIVSDNTPCFVAVPRTVHLWRRAPCNGRCIMCSYGFLQGEALREHSSSPFTDDLMPRALNEIHELCGRGTLVSYMGGEPTISRHIMDWIEQAGRLGLDFRFTTNGYSMNEEMARRFVGAGLFNIGISLESLDAQTNETIRPFPNSTERAVRCVELLLQERERQKKHISLNIKTVLTNVNLESFHDIVKRFGKIDGVICTPQIFEPLEDMPAGTRQLLMINDFERLRRVTDDIRQLKRERYSVHVTDQALDEMLRQCADPSTASATMAEKTLQMDPSEPECNIATDNLWIENGRVMLCIYHPPIGDFVEGKQTLAQMWHSEMATRVRKATRACRRLCTVSCLRRTPLTHKISMFMKLG